MKPNKLALCDTNKDEKFLDAIIKLFSLWAIIKATMMITFLKSTSGQNDIITVQQAFSIPV